MQELGMQACHGSCGFILVHWNGALVAVKAPADGDSPLLHEFEEKR